MKKLMTLAVSTLLMVSNSFAASSSGIDSHSLFQSLRNNPVSSTSDKGDLEMVYGGKDISRAGVDVSKLGLDSPVLVG